MCYIRTTYVQSDSYSEVPPVALAKKCMMSTKPTDKANTPHFWDALPVKIEKSLPLLYLPLNAYKNLLKQSICLF